MRRAPHTLTDKTVKALKATGTNYRVRDGHTPGLALAVTASGAKSWEFWFQSPETGKRRPLPLGRYPDTTLAAARAAVPPLRNQIQSGADPIEAQKRDAAQKDLEKVGTFGKLLRLYQDKLVAEGSEVYAKRVGQDMARNLSPEMLARSAGEITQHHVLGLMHGVVARAKTRGYTGDRTADYLRTYISAAYEFVLDASNTKWAVRAAPFRHLILNPAQRIKKFQKVVGVGQRNLTSQELRTLWHSVGVDALHPDMALFVKLSLALGGQRVEELLYAPWSEFDMVAREWSIPIERRKIRKKAKHREPHVIYLTDLAIALLEALWARTGDTLYLFPNQARTAPRTLWSADKAIARFCTPGPQSVRAPFSHFTPRDLRRTAKTLMGRAGLSKEIRDRLQGHVFRDVSSVHYDRYDYWLEKKSAMEIWATWLDDLVAQPLPTAKVIPLRGLVSEGH